MQILHPISFPETHLSEWKSYRLVLLLVEKNFHNYHKQNKVNIPLIQVWGSHHLLCIPSIQKVWASHHLQKRKCWRYMQMFLKEGNISRRTLQVQIEGKLCACKTCTKKVPIHLQEDFHAERHDLVKQDVIEKVEHSTEWVNSFIIVEKDVSMDSGNSHVHYHKVKKKLWICLNPRDLKDTLKYEPYYSQSVDELIAKFHRCKVSSIVDMKKVYWMVPLHPNSRPLTCISIDIGRFQWTRLPMGLSVTSNVFQKKPDEIFQNVQGVTGITDDMIICGKSRYEHDVHFLNFLSIVILPNGLI